MVIICFIPFIFFHSIHSYPDGAPSCSSRPNHGVNRKGIQLEAKKISDRQWQIRIKEKHRGLLLTSTGTGGIWYGHVPGYKDLGKCVTHINREEKNSATFIFRTHRDEEPRFSGFVVTDYKSYAVIDEDSVNYFDITQRTNDTLLAKKLDGLYGRRKSGTDKAYGFGKSLLDGSLKSLLGTQNSDFTSSNDQIGYGSSLNKFGIGRYYGNNNNNRRNSNQNNGFGSLNGYGSKFGRNAFGYSINGEGIDNKDNNNGIASLYGSGKTDRYRDNVYALLKLYTKR